MLSQWELISRVSCMLASTRMNITGFVMCPYRFITGKQWLAPDQWESGTSTSPQIWTTVTPLTADSPHSTRRAAREVPHPPASDKPYLTPGFGAREVSASSQHQGARLGASPAAGRRSPCAAGQTPFCCSPLLFSAENSTLAAGHPLPISRIFSLLPLFFL